MKKYLLVGLLALMVSACGPIRTETTLQATVTEVRHGNNSCGAVFELEDGTKKYLTASALVTVRRCNVLIVGDTVTLTRKTRDYQYRERPNETTYHWDASYLQDSW